MKKLKLSRIFFENITKELLGYIIGGVEFKKLYAGKTLTYCGLLPCGFDIEAYKQYQYIWTFTIKEVTIIGYTKEEFKTLLNMIKEVLHLGREKKTVKHRDGSKEDKVKAPRVITIFIHNIKYEYSFYRKILKFDEIFYIDKHERNPLYLLAEDSFLMLDSFKLYPMSLAEVARCYCTTRKTHDLDYNKPRTIEDAKHLTEKELTYCCNDTKILSELASYTFKTYFEPYQKIMMTQNQIIKAIIKNEYNTTKDADLEKKLKNITLSQDQYIFIRRDGFRGGHCQSSECDITGDIGYGDETSAYFSAIMHGYYPMSKYRTVLIKPKTEDDIDRKAKDYCCQMYIKFYNLIVAGDKLVKYESKRKVTRFMPDGSDPRYNDDHTLVDEDRKTLRQTCKVDKQGKVWKAACIAVSINEIDWEIYKKVYTWDKIEVLRFEIADRGPLPEYIKQTALKLYEKKAKLKKDGHTKGSEYISAKTLVSTIFGSMVQKIDDAIVDGSESKWYATQLDNILKPQWGCYVSSHARNVLINIILALGIESWLYSDTDSVYYIKTAEAEKVIYNYNTEMMNKNKEMCIKYNLDFALFGDLGCFDDDNKNITRFKTLGAKAYMYVTDKGEYCFTLSGIPEEFFWQAYVEKYGTSVAIKDKDKEINRVFDFFEKDTEIKYTRKVVKYVEDTDDIINGVKVHCDCGCIIEEQLIVGTLSSIQEVVALETAMAEEEDNRV